MITRAMIIIFLVAGCFQQLKAQKNTDLELAHTYYRQGEYDKAAEIYKKLSTERNYAALIHYDYVATLFKLKDYVTAEKFIRSQIQAFGNNFTYRVHLAGVFENSGRVGEAEKEFDKLIIEAAPTDGKTNELLNYFIQNQKYESLIKLVQKYRDLSSNKHKYDNWLAYSYRMLNMKDKMLEEVMNSGIRMGDLNGIKATIQDYFVTEDEIAYVENYLYSKIQENPEETAYAEILIWWFAQKGDFSRAFVQARALDKRLKQNGYGMFELGGQSYLAKDYKNSTRMYKYIMDEYPEGDLYPYARTWMIKSQEELIKNTFPLDMESIKDLISQYQMFISEVGSNVKTAEAMRNLALLQAFYLNDYTEAINTLERAIASVKTVKKYTDECKLDLGDIYILKDEPWESTLLYLQVEKSQKETNIGENAKLRNAKLQYFTGQFKLAKEILDVLKKATTKEIANDAMQLSLLIEDNTGLDSTETALAAYAQVELLVFQNKLDEAIIALDSLYNLYKEHSLSDEILWLRANTLLKVNRIEEAVVDLNKLIDNYKTDTILADDALFLLAKVTEENLKDKTKAMELYKKILTDFPGSIFNAQARVKFRELRGDYVN